MPNKDGTGPEGKGPKTGRQMGKCKDANPEENSGKGRGMGMGCRPCGRGFRRNRNFDQNE